MPTFSSELEKYGPDYLAQLDDEESLELEALLDGAEQDHIDSLCAQNVASFTAGPLFWATTLTATENPNHEGQGLPFRNPLPRKSYFVPLFAAFQRIPPPPRKRRMFIPKTREMLTSWSAVAYAVTQAQWHKWDCLFQTASLQKASELIDYGSQLWRNQREWLKQRHPLKKDPTTFEIEWADGGRMMALPSGEDKVRLYHPTLYVMDEAAFLPEAQECYDAAEPVAHQIIAISSAGPGWFGGQCSR